MVVGDGEHSRWTVLMNRQGGVRGVHGFGTIHQGSVENGEYSETDSILRPRSFNLKSPVKSLVAHARVASRGPARETSTTGRPRLLERRARRGLKVYTDHGDT